MVAKKNSLLCSKKYDGYQKNALLKEQFAGEIQDRKPVKVYYPEFGNQVATDGGSGESPLRGE